MILFGTADNSISADDRAMWLTGPFDIALGVVVPPAVLTYPVIVAKSQVFHGGEIRGDVFAGGAIEADVFHGGSIRSEACVD